MHTSEGVIRKMNSLAGAKAISSTEISEPSITQGDDGRLLCDEENFEPEKETIEPLAHPSVPSMSGKEADI